MSSTASDALSTSNFKADWNEGSFSKCGFIRWIGDDEFLLAFDKYCLIYRLTPFFTSASLAEIFPVTVTRIEPNADRSSSILNLCLSLLNIAEFDPSYARCCCVLNDWTDVNKTLADPVFLHPPVSTLTGSQAGESTISISSVIVEDEQRKNVSSAPKRPLVVIMLADGRAYAASKIGEGRYDMIHLSSILRDYVNLQPDLLCGLLISTPTDSASTEKITGLQWLKRFHRLGCFLSMKHWLPTDLRFEEFREDAYAISIQRSGHIILWKYSDRPAERNFEVVKVAIPANIADSISAAAVIPIGPSRCILLVGTTRGGIVWYPVNLSSEDNGFVGSGTAISKSDDDICISLLRPFDLGSGRQLLIVCRCSLLTAMVLAVSDSGVTVEHRISATTPARFAISDAIRLGDTLYVVSPSKVLKYGVHFEAGLGLELTAAGTAVPLEENKRLVGFAVSKNGLLQLRGVLTRFLDRYSRSKALAFYVNQCMEPAEFWNALMERAHLKDAADFLMLLRSFILHPGQAKAICDLLIRDLESLDSDEDPNVLSKLKVFRFATGVLSGKRSKADDLEFWNRVKEKVERLLFVRLAKAIIKQGENLARAAKLNAGSKQSVAAVMDYLNAEGVKMTWQFEKLTRPRCPLCNADALQSSTISEHVCANNHRLPACSISFLPIASFAYQKCARCGLPVLDAASMAELADLIPETNYCRFCDGEIIPVSNGS